MRCVRFIGAVALSALMCGCGPKGPLPLSPRQVVPGQAFLDLREVAEGNLRVEPARSGCGEHISPIKVAVVWDVTGIEHIEDRGVLLLGVMDAGGRWKTFASARDAKGRAETGGWVLPGTTFFLVDGRTKRVLGQAAFMKGLCGGNS